MTNPYVIHAKISEGEVADLKATIADQAAQIAALTAAAEGARAGAIEEAAAAVERAAVALDQRKCCGVGVYSAHGGPPECCSDPLYMISSQAAATAIRALAAGPADERGAG